ncbi:MAG: sel1 repeat family protein [Synergistaceae bacterium]|nr:sel1 repeat family protein [Synergistaceae bacterium]
MGRCVAVYVRGSLWMAIMVIFALVLASFLAPTDLNTAAFAAAASADKMAEQRTAITPEQAFPMLQAEAEKGDAQALITLGGFYAEGAGVQKNFSKARECYEKAAQAGMAEGVYNVGVCWEVGMGSEADPKRAAEYFRKAADMELPQAMFKMSMVLDSGSGVDRDEKASIDYMAKAADAGHPDAASIMGLVYLNGMRGQKKDTEAGIKMLKAAASSGNAEAMKNIAVVYKDGIGLAASPSEALKWYVIAEKCGYPAEALSAVTAELRRKMSGEQQKKAETEADAWINAARAAARR